MSQQLLDLINSDPAAKAAFDTSNDQGAIDVLNAATVTQLHVGRKQAGEVMAVLIAASIDPSSVLTTVASGGNELLKSFLRVLEAQGADFSTDDNQMILAQYPDATVRAVLLGVGRSTVSPAQDAMGRAVTLEDMTAGRAWQTRQAEIADRIAYLAVLQAVLDQQAGILADPNANVPTRADILAALGAG